MAIELITGRYGTPHIGSEDVRAYQAYTAGSGRYVLHGGGATIQSANDVHLNPAEILIDGAHVRITGLGEDVTLENGTSSYNRVDIVALHYLMTGSEDEAVESVTLEVVKGTPSELTPSDPEMPASGSILDNVTETYVPYVRVLIEGLVPQAPEVLLPDYMNPADISGDGDQVNPSVLVNLGSRSSDTVFKANPRPGVYGILPVANGGTGASTASKALRNLGITATAGQLNVLPEIVSKNDSNEVELNWTEGGLKGRVMKKLWAGTFTSGSLTIDELPYYNLFVAYVSADLGNSIANTPVLLMRNALNTQLHGFGGVVLSTGDTITTSANFGVSGTKLTYIGVTRSISYGTQNYDNMALLSLYGLL